MEQKAKSVTLAEVPVDRNLKPRKGYSLVPTTPHTIIFLLKKVLKAFTMPLVLSH
jgi:hypothetical protein